jgi:hypothetical protein
MIVLLMIYAGLLTAFVIGLIYYYEDKIKLLNGNLNRLRSLPKDNLMLDVDNGILREQVKKLKLELLESKQPEYESKAYVNPYNNPMGKE